MKALPLALALALFALVVQDGKKPALLEVGKEAPAFRLNDHTGKVVALGGKRENWTVVAFFPKAATPG